MTLVHNSFEKTFGGFTKESWDTSGREPKDLESFLFSLDVNQKYEFNNSGRAILCTSGHGAVFGGGSDFRINSNFKEPNGCFSNPNNSFTIPGGHAALAGG